ncbi:MAG TPA: hypothetical protein PLJ71_21935, partial [Candidatus Hydrogenedentes bacterium]|nr:hypothetical protein [Candidatus Hydrogenedentota bacterium]
MRYTRRPSQRGMSLVSGVVLLGLFFTFSCLASAQDTVLTIDRAALSDHYVPGGTLDIAVTFSKEGSGTVSALALYETLPAGWTYNSPVSVPGMAFTPASGSSGTLEFFWLGIPSFPATLVYRVNVPGSQSGTATICGYAEYRLGGGPLVTSTVCTPIPGQNRAPELGAIGNQSVAEGGTLDV